MLVAGGDWFGFDLGCSDGSGLFDKLVTVGLGCFGGLWLRLYVGLGCDVGVSGLIWLWVGVV